MKKLVPLLIAAALLLSFSPTLLAAPDAFGYDCQVVTPAYIEASTVIGLGGDDEYQEVTLPFSFPFYGIDYNSVFVNTNGFLSFLSGYQYYYNNYSIPSSASPDGAIYAFWDDLHVDGEASIRTEQLTSPNRFVIEWRNVKFIWGNETQRVDFEVVLYETGDILVQYRNISDDSLERGDSATIGIENETNTIAYQYSYDTAMLPVGESALLYSVRSSETVIPSMAAPNIAGIILDAEGVQANQSFGRGKSRTFINLIQQTAAHMGPQTDFDGVSKSLLVGDPGEEVESLNPDYWQAVLDFLNGRISYYGLGIGPLTYSYDDYVEDQYGPGPGVTLPFSEDFTGVTAGEIPVGWSETAAYPNWAVQNSNYAYGYSPEMVFSWATPSSFNGISRLITPEIDASTNSDVELTFAHAVSHWMAPYALKVQVSVDDGATWADAWSINPTAGITPQVVTVDLSAYDGQTFQLAWVFEGDSYNINWWYIDDILVTGS